MKLNWFSPLPPVKSGIAEYTEKLLPFFQRSAELTLWTAQHDWDSDLEEYAEVHHYEPTDPPWFQLNQADLNIYHIGNHPDYHYSIWRIACQCPGIVVLHDLKLQHLFAGIYRDKQRNQYAYLLQMQKYYGNKGRKVAEQFWQGKLTIEYVSERYPFTFLALEQAIGVVVHTRTGFRKISEKNQWPVLYAPLPHIERSPIQETTTVEGKPYRLVMFGYIGANRCLELVLNALSQFFDREAFHLDIYGQVWDKDYVDRKIHSLGIGNLVNLHGYVQEDELNTVLANAHLAVNLRNPTMGEASLSQLRIWSFALPSLVTRAGWYAEQPHDTVFFVRPGHEIEDIHRHLREFLLNPDKFTEVGRKGFHHFRKNHDPQKYAQAILDFAAETIKARQASATGMLVSRVAKELSSWTSSKSLDSQTKRMAEAIHFIVK